MLAKQNAIARNVLNRFTAHRMSCERPLRLLVLQPTPFCNIACDYCYLAHRADARRMSTRVVEATLKNVRDSGLLADELSVIWHAGEPLTVPSSFYRESFALVDEIVGQHARVSHCIQTNGVLIDHEWCDLFTQWGVRVGISLDGPAFLHDKHRKTRDGRPTHRRVMEGIDCLRKHHLPFHVIAVVTRDSLDYAADIVNFFCEQDITQIGFNIDESEGAHTECSLHGREDDYEEFMRRVIKAARHAPIDMQVREIQNALQIISKGIPKIRVGDRTVPYNPQTVPAAILSVDHQGGFTTYSPELLDHQHNQYGSFLLGNVMTDSIAVAITSDKARSIARDILAGVDACQRSCEYFEYCGGGAPVNKLTENGDFASAETLYCRCAIQAPFKATLEAMEEALDCADPVVRPLEQVRSTQTSFWERFR